MNWVDILLGLTGLIFFLSKGLSRVFSSTKYLVLSLSLSFSLSLFLSLSLYIYIYIYMYLYAYEKSNNILYILRSKSIFFPYFS